MLTFETKPNTMSLPAVQQFNDPGPFFVLENGKLRPPPGMGHRAYSPHERQDVHKLHQPIFSTETAPTATAPSSRTPRKLYDITLDFVAANVTLVDSLVDFPEIVARQLFDAAHRLGKLGPQALQLFCDAYGETILRSVSLQGHHLVVDKLLKYGALLLGLSELELGGCGLGDDTEILRVIANLNSLTRLGLASNDLTDSGIQRLTTPLRVMGRGPRQLVSLDLAGNGCISDKSASQFLTTFTSLRSLDLSGCNISSVGIDVLKKQLKLEDRCSPHTTPTEPFLPPVQNIGWALPLVEQWIESSTSFMQKGKSKASMTSGSSKAASFYGRTQKRLANVSKSTLPKKKPKNISIIQLIAATTRQDKPQAGPMQREMVKVSKGGRVQVERCQDLEGITNVDNELPALNKELTRQYSLQETRCPLQEKKQDRKRLDWSRFEFETEVVKVTENKTDASRRIKPAKPPPRKRIKLSSLIPSRAFSDILCGVESKVTTEDKETLARQKVLDRSGGIFLLDENQAGPCNPPGEQQLQITALRNQANCSDREVKKTGISAASSREGPSRGAHDERNKEDRGSLWNMMNSNYW